MFLIVYKLLPPVLFSLMFSHQILESPSSTGVSHLLEFIRNIPGIEKVGLIFLLIKITTHVVELPIEIKPCVIV